MFNHHPKPIGPIWLTAWTVCGCLCALAHMAACRPQAPTPLPVTPHVETKAQQPGTTPHGSNGEATLLLMADLRGVLRPCGCTVDLQKGGFDRLKPHLEQQRKHYPHAKLLHAGPLFFDEAQPKADLAHQKQRQAEVAAELWAEVKVDVAACDAVDVVASKGGFAKLLSRSKVRITTANLTLNKKSLHLNPHMVEQVGGLRVGIFALASPEAKEDFMPYGIITDPVRAASQTVAELKGKCDVILLLSGLGLRHTKRLVRAVDGIHFAVAGGLGDFPVASDEAELVGTTRVMQFHREGRFVGRLSIRLLNGQVDFVDASAPSEAELKAFDARIASLKSSLERWDRSRSEDDYELRSARHHLASLKDAREKLQAKQVKVPSDQSSFSFRQTPLNWDLPQDPDLLAIMDAFDKELKEINLAHVGTLPEPKPGQALYAGVDACLDCHDDAQTYWDHDRHQKAWETLVKVGKTFDAECVSCHVTGYGKAGGSILGKTEGREDVQCEACHGPGSLHVDSDGDVAPLLAKPKEDLCIGCHNKHHSPHFEFAKWRKKIVVPGHGLPL
jgi:hypothetical protein